MTRASFSVVRDAAAGDPVAAAGLAELAAAYAVDPSNAQDLFARVLTATDCAPLLATLWNSGVVAAVWPEVAELDMDDAQSRLHKDNLAHTFEVTAMCPPRLRVRLLALFHDVGKPSTRKVEGSTVTFHNHERVGARLAAAALRRAGFDEDLVDDVAFLVAHSGHVASFDGSWSDSAVRRTSRTIGALLDDLCDFSAVDCTSGRPGRRAAAQRRVEEFRARAAAVAAADEAARWRPPLSGVDVMDLLGLPQGPDVGAAMKFMAEAAPPDAAAARVALLDWWAARS